jgi:hypothetical protein
MMSSLAMPIRRKPHDPQLGSPRTHARTNTEWRPCPRRKRDQSSALAAPDIGNPRPLFTDLVIPAITVFRGRFVETMRDGMLVEFASIIDEVKCPVTNPR